MACIHGLEDNNCPICRISRHITPPKDLDRLNIRKNPLKPYFNKKNNEQSIKEDILPSLMRDKVLLGINSINPIPEVKSLNSLPTFENRMFIERISELDLGNIDTHKISKKTRLSSPELKFENK